MPPDASGGLDELQTSGFSAELDAWLLNSAEGEVTAIKPIAGGGARKTYFVSRKNKPDLVLQVTGKGAPYHGTGITSLAREAQIFATISKTTAAAIGPTLVGLSPDESAILTLRAPGDSDFNTLRDVVQRRSITMSMMEKLAVLHAVDERDIERIGLPNVGTGKSVALSALAIWEALFDRVSRPVPLVRFAIEWLKDHAPDCDGAPVLTHGDVGPGNFLFLGEEVTTLLDWELARAGDYHLDLGLLAIRGFQLGGMPDLDAALTHYAQLSGRRVDGWKVKFYRANCLLLGLVTSLVQLDKSVSSREPMIAMPLYLHLVPLFQVWLADAICDLAGKDIVVPEPLQPLPDMEALDAAVALMSVKDELAALGSAGGHVGFGDILRTWRPAPPTDGRRRRESWKTQRPSLHRIRRRSGTAGPSSMRC